MDATTSLETVRYLAGALERSRPWIPLSLFLVGAVAGCDHNVGSQAEIPASYPPTNAFATPAVLPGRLEGTVTIDDVDHGMTGIFTPDGEVRMYVDGVPEESFDPRGSVQLVGHLTATGGQASGAGVIIGEGCALPEPSRFCAAIASWQIALTAKSTSVDQGAMGEVHVTTSEREEIWLLRTGYWGGRASFDAASDLRALRGLYRERFAEFALAGDVLLNVDDAGRFFFQSPVTGCVGNGALAPHRDGQLALYDVTLTIEACAAPYEYLNTTYEGLSTSEAGTPWDYDSWLKMWLSTAPGPSSSAALTLWASMEY